ncbi:type IV pilus modification PilV family protein [Undibacterium flavidum]|uniref:Prepilin-type N-terminal cleavage/methylation domain-containing protein n=1 Tax=Undibacterium flavidum TaxID=2762297 RepID=A0ABR6YFH4_9BURK|nr:prepilin-type N-terminal cleavage/methylation domain-containing protein [Undibacterium flavidum]MBC3875277.1 prepilin-type N-terminal cleavage/methylation domain-containing protein [Undibacterium flavidum]
MYIKSPPVTGRLSVWTRRRRHLWTKQKGVTLIELILFMLIVSIAVIGVTRIMNITSVASTDPLREKQALALAESMLEEIQLQAFTFCDPDDANAMTAYSAADCASEVQGLGKSAGETRGGVPRFDNVGDYFGYGNPVPVPVVDIQGLPIAGLGNYSMSVFEVYECGGACIRIDVTVSVDDVRVVLTGYRYRYAPRTVP